MKTATARFLDHHRGKRTFALLLALAMLAVACGGGEPEGEAGEAPEEQADDEADTDAEEGEDGEDGGGQASGLLGELQEAGTISVGIANEEPYGFENEEGEITGEAIEVAREVLPGIGIDSLEATIVDFNSLISGLQAEQFDMIAAGMYINAERAEQILFSDPDYCIGEAFAVEEGNPLGLTDFQSVVDTPEATIAILSGGVEEGYAATAGVPDDQIQLFSGVNEQYSALEAGRVDAVTGTALTVQNQVADREGYEATESFFPLDEDGEEILGCGGFGFRNSNQELRDAFNEELNALQEEGELLPIIEGFGFVTEDIERAQELTVEDLTE